METIEYKKIEVLLKKLNTKIEAVGAEQKKEQEQPIASIQPLPELPSQSEEIKDLMVAFVKAQGELKPADKNRKSTQNGGYEYSNIDALNESIIPIFSKNGLAVIHQPMFLRDETLIVFSKIIHSSTGQWIGCYLPVKTDFPGSPAHKLNHELASSMTYMKKMALTALTGIICGETDDDALVENRKR